MPTTNTREIGLEELITNYLVTQNGFAQKFYSGEHSNDYNKKEAIDTTALFEFLTASQPEELEKLQINYGADFQKKFLERLQKEMTNLFCGFLGVIRNVLAHSSTDLKDIEALYGLNVVSYLFYQLDKAKNTDIFETSVDNKISPIYNSDTIQIQEFNDCLINLLTQIEISTKLKKKYLSNPPETVQIVFITTIRDYLIDNISTLPIGFLITIQLI